MLNHKVAGHRSIKALVTCIGLICYVRLSGFRHGVYHLEQRTSTFVNSCVSKSFCINFLDGVSEFESDHFIFGDRHFRRNQICRPLTKVPEGLGRHCVFKYSETRLLRTLKGNEKRYVLTKVRSIQNAIFLTGRTSSLVHANDLPRKMLLRPVRRSLLAFRTVKSPLRASWTWKRAGKLKSKLKGWMTCSWSEKRTKERAKKCSWRENWYVISDFVPRLVRLIRKKCTSFPIGDVRDWRRERYNRVYVLCHVRTNRVSLY